MEDLQNLIMGMFMVIGICCFFVMLMKGFTWTLLRIFNYDGWKSVQCETMLEQLDRYGYCEPACHDNPLCGNGSCANLPDAGTPKIDDDDSYYSVNDGYVDGRFVKAHGLLVGEDCFLNETAASIRKRREKERLANNPIARAVHDARGGNSPPTERTEWS